MTLSHRPIAARALLRRFTSLGDNCELGLTQRRAGAEPLSLFRLAYCDLDALVAALDDGFADLDPPRRIEVLQPWSDEFVTYFGERGFHHHTLMGSAETDAVTLRRQELTRIPFLRRRLMEDLASAETIFVRRSSRHDPDGMHALHQALRRHGRNRLLWVEQGGAPAGTVEQVSDSLFRGSLDRFSPAGDAAAVSFDGWLQLCRKTLDLLGDDPLPAITPPALNIGVDVFMIGWDGVTCVRGGPVPGVTPDGVVFTHASATARTCCGAVLNPKPPLIEGATYTASVYVWLPRQFAGRGITPFLTHTIPPRTLYAILQERDRWQRIWVTAAVPRGTSGVDFGLLVELAAGDVFYSTEWCIEQSAVPGDYLLRDAPASR